MRAHLINRYGLYQGTTLVVPDDAVECEGFSPCKIFPQGLKPGRYLQR